MKPLFATLALVASTLLATPSHAQSYPDKPVKIIVPWGTGGSTDAIARTFAQRLSETAGQSFIVENKPGAGAAIGTNDMAKAPYDLRKELEPIALIGTSPLLLFASTESSPKSLTELVATAKAKPGTLSLAHSGNGSASHLAAELLQQKTGAKFNLASYKGTGPAMLDVAGGHVGGHFATFAGGGGSLKSGKVSLLGAATVKRIDSMKETPTFAESGVSDFVVEQWWGLVVPRGTPAAVSEKLRALFSGAMTHDTVQKRLRELAVEPRTMSAAEFANFVDAETTRWANVVKTAGIRAE
jgi:tripartite-type tricarboxylate transporter receptor subunit TctC